MANHLSRSLCLTMLLGVLLTPGRGLCERPRGPDSLVGRWENTNSRTRNIPFLDVEEDQGQFRLHVWGACHPSPCDWGTFPAESFAQEVGEDPALDAIGLTASHLTSFSQTLLTLKLRRSRILEVDLFTRYSDESGRSPTVQSLRMLRRNADFDSSAAGKNLRIMKLSETSRIRRPLPEPEPLPLRKITPDPPVRPSEPRPKSWLGN